MLASVRLSGFLCAPARARITQCALVPAASRFPWSHTVACSLVDRIIWRCRSLTFSRQVRRYCMCSLVVIVNTIIVSRTEIHGAVIVAAQVIWLPVATWRHNRMVSLPADLCTVAFLRDMARTYAFLF